MSPGSDRRGALAVAGFLLDLCREGDLEGIRRAFYALAVHVPGLGGVQGFDALGYDEVDGLLAYLREVAEAKERALKGGR